MAFLSQGLTIRMRDERVELSEDGAPREAYHYDGGIAGFVRYLNAKKGTAYSALIEFEMEDTDRRISVEVAMRWNAGFTESVYTFANTIATHEGGTHHEGSARR